MNLSLPARLLVAHILGDFVFQSDKWVARRNEKNFRSPVLYAHGFAHFALAWLFAFDPGAWWVGAIIGAGHILFDGMKALMKRSDIVAFIVDQALHLLIIFLCCCIIVRYEAIAAVHTMMHAQRGWLITSGYLLNIFLYPPAYCPCDRGLACACTARARATVQGRQMDWCNGACARVHLCADWSDCGSRISACSKKCFSFWRPA